MKRDLNIDALKGFLILCVVIGHFNMQVVFGIHTDTIVIKTLSDLFSRMHVYYYHVPLFFAISVLYVHTFNLDFFKKTFIAIIIPYFIWYYRPTLIYTPLHDIQQIFRGFSGFITGNFHTISSPLWFLPSLFSTKIFYAGFMKLYQYRKTLAIAAMMATWGIVYINVEWFAKLHVKGTTPFGIDIALYFLPYYFLIATAYKKKDLLFKIPYTVLAACLYISAYLIYMFEPAKTHSEFHFQIDLAQMSVPTHLLGILGFIFLSLSLFILFLKLRPWSLFVLLGQYSLPIFLLHYYFFGVLNQWVTSWTGVDRSDWSNATAISAGLTIFLICVFAPILVSKVVMRISPVFKYAGFVP